jgi:hypothetical protein
MSMKSQWPSADHPALRPHDGGPRRWARSTLEFASLHDHARLPARFFGRLVASALAGLAAR